MARQLNRGSQERPPTAGTSRAVTESLVPPSVASGRRKHLPLVLLGVAIAAAATVVVILLVQSGSHASALPASNSGPVLVSQAQLERLAAATAHPLYWAGPKNGYSYELTMVRGGRVYVRYLPKGVKAGDPRPRFLVVGTYEQAGSFAYLKHAAKAKGSLSLGIDTGGVAVFSSASPTSVYFTYPGAKYQVEVYDPSADTARRLVLAGKITPIR